MYQAKENLNNFQRINIVHNIFFDGNAHKEIKSQINNEILAFLKKSNHTVLNIT